MLMTQLLLNAGYSGNKHSSCLILHEKPCAESYSIPVYSSRCTQHLLLTVNLADLAYFALLYKLLWFHDEKNEARFEVNIYVVYTND